MSDQRRIRILVISVSAGILLSLLMYKVRFGTLTSDNYFFLGTIYFFSLALLIGIFFLFRKFNQKDKLK